MGISQTTQPQEILGILCKDKETIFAVTELEEPSHSWADHRLDLEKEEGGAAAYKSYVQDLIELLPSYNTPLDAEKYGTARKTLKASASRVPASSRPGLRNTSTSREKGY